MSAEHRAVGGSMAVGGAKGYRRSTGLWRGKGCGVVAGPGTPSRCT